MYENNLFFSVEYKAQNGILSGTVCFDLAYIYVYCFLCLSLDYNFYMNHCIVS